MECLSERQHFFLESAIRFAALDQMACTRGATQRVWIDVYNLRHTLFTIKHHEWVTLATRHACADIVPSAYLREITNAMTHVVNIMITLANECDD